MTLLVCILSILIGYLLGTISPSFILGKILKNIDIREHGTRNAGTMNAYRILGLGPAVITAFFDLSKGLLAMLISHLLGASPLCMHLAGFSAILGHVFPFYLRFRGGQGSATATAILIYYLVLFYSHNWLPFDSLLYLAITVFVFIYIAKKGEIVGIVTFPVLVVFLSVFAPFSPYLIFILTIIAYIFYIAMINVLNFKLLKLRSPKGKEEINWRLYLRPLAILLVIYYFKTDEREALTLIGSIVLFFLLLDLIRLFSKKVNVFFFLKVKEFYKQKEYKRFSSITIFLFAYFLTILLFEKNIAILAGSFLTFGDFFSKFFGIYFGRTRIFEKTLEGSLAHFNACLLSGYIFLHFIPFSFPIFLLGALIASISEALPLGINDNFSVALLSASTMYVFRLF